MKNSNCHDKMAVVVEIPVSARIGMLESLQCLNNKPFTPVEAESHCRRTSQSSTGQRKAGFNTTEIRNFNKLKEPVTNTKSSRSTTFISKTKYQYVKMTGEHFEKESMLVEELYPKFRSKSSESMESEDSSSQGSGVYDKRLSLLSGLSHSDYETCGSQTSLDEYENDRLSVSSGLKEDTLIIVNKTPDGRTSRPLSSVLGDSELDDIDCDIDDVSKSEEANSGVPKRKPERPACLDQGMDATMTWLRKELTEMRALDQSLMRQFMDIQSKIRNLKLQHQQQKQKQIAMWKQKQPKQLLSDHSSELLGNHRFSWELDSLYEEDEYYDYDTEDDLDDEGDLPSMGACGGYS